MYKKLSLKKNTAKYYSVYIVCVMIFCGTGCALLKHEIPLSKFKPPDYLSGTKKIVVYKSDPQQMAIIGTLKAKVTFDYTDRKVLIVDNKELESLSPEERKNLRIVDEMNKIYLRDRVIDATKPTPTVPEKLRMQPRVGNQLHLLQFAGPVKDEWLETVKSQGKVKIISYLRNNAYLFWTDSATLKKLQALSSKVPYLQWMGYYHPAYKIHPTLQKSTDEYVQVTVQFVGHKGVNTSIKSVKRQAKKLIREQWTVGVWRQL